MIKPWQSKKLSDWRFLYAGGAEGVVDNAEILNATESGHIEPLVAKLKTAIGHFGFIATRGGTVIAAADSVRSYPVFMLRNKKGFFSPDAVALLKNSPFRSVDKLSSLEMALAGYATDNNTVYQNISQIRPGEIIVAKQDAKLVSKRYFTFFPDNRPSGSESNLLEELGSVTDAIFSRIVEETKNNTIIVPLSGGLDSRLVLSKLIEHGCAQIKTFSYGPPGNGEASIAKSVAKRLGVSWCFFPSHRITARHLFQSNLRSEYWKMASGLCSTPNMQEFQVIWELKQNNWLPDNAIIINGQSGDFISGGHIPAMLMEPEASWQDCFKSIVNKHMMLWPELTTDKAIKKLETRAKRVVAELTGDRCRQLEQGWSYAYNSWEWAERQSKFVVNQQRTYDFFNLPWRLPLWDREYLDFWKNVPAKYMFEQRLYKTYLNYWNYKGIFKDRQFTKTILRWPGLWRLAVPLARMTGAIGGKRIKDCVYAYLKYYGHYSNQYAAYSYPYFAKRALKIRNTVSLFSETWLNEWVPNEHPLATYLAP